jgi:hypothetical protein
MSPFAMLGDADALACEGDSCLLPAAVATVGALTPSGPTAAGAGAGGTETGFTATGSAEEAAVSR